MHIFSIQPYATKDGKKQACHVFHSFCGKSVHIGTTKLYSTYPAGVRADDEAKRIIRRYIQSLNLHLIPREGNIEVRYA